MRAMFGLRDVSGRFLVLLVVVDLGELRVDDVLLGAATRAAGAARAAVSAGAALRGLFGLLVHRLAELHRSLRERIGLGLDRLGVVALHGLLQVGERVLDGAPLVLADLGAVLGESLLGRMDHGFGVVLGLDLGLAPLVFLGVRLGVLDHALDVGFGETARRLNADLLDRKST